MTGSEKLRALLLATLMVLSVVGGTVAFAGTAAAAGNTQFEFANPTSAQEGSTVDNQVLNFTTDFASADGNTDTIQVTFDNNDIQSLSVNSASANTTSVSSSAQVVDGPDGDGVQDTIEFGLSDPGQNTAFQIDTAVTYATGTDGAADVNVTVIDSDGSTEEPRFTGVVTLESASQVTDAFEDPLPTGSTDNTDFSNTAPGLTVQVGNISFDQAGNVNNVTVDAGDNIPATSISSVTVKAQNQSQDQTVDSASASYDGPTTVELGQPANNSENVDRVIVEAKLSSGASAGERIDAILTFAVNPTGTIDTDGTQTVTDTDTFVRAAVSTTQNPNYEGADVQFVNVDTGTVVAERTTNANGLTPSVQVGPDQNYTAIVNETGFFTASSNTRLIAEGDTEELDVTLTPRGIPRNIEVIAAEPSSGQAPADGSSEIAYYVQVTGEFGANEDVPLNNLDVESGVVTGTSLTLTPAVNTTEEVTLPNGTTVNGTTVFTVSSDEVQQANISFTTAANQSIKTFAQPEFGVLAGEGTIQGQVVAEDTTEGLSDARVHAVDFDRFVQNERLATPNIGGGDTDYFRVVNSTTGEVVDVDNYRVVIGDIQDQAVGEVEFLNESDRGVGSGFFVKDRDATDTDNSTLIIVVPLETGDYSLEVSETAPESSREASPASQGTESFTESANFAPTTQNLTYENAEAQSSPYDQGGPVLTDMTDEDGDYVLSKLFTDFQQGGQYVVIAQKTGYSTDFVDVNVTESGADYIIYDTVNNENFEAGGADENLNLKPRQVTPEVNLTNVGYANGVEDGELVGFQEFDNQSDAFPQQIIRDGEYTDVFNVTTTGKETDTPVNATVEIELEDDYDINGDDDSLSANETNFVPEWVTVAGGSVVSTDVQNDTITITTGADGQAQVWLTADSDDEDLSRQNALDLANAEPEIVDDLPTNPLVNEEATIPPYLKATAVQNPSEPDITYKNVEAPDRFKQASLSGILTDDNDVRVNNTVVYAANFRYNIDTLFGGTNLAAADTIVFITPDDAANSTTGLPNGPVSAEDVDDPSDEFHVVQYRWDGINSQILTPNNPPASRIGSEFNVTRSELTNYTFDASVSDGQGFPLIDGQGTEFKLVERNDASDSEYTLRPVPAVGAATGSDTTAYTVRGVGLDLPDDKQVANASDTVKPGFTGTANLAFGLALNESLAVSNLQAPSTAQAGDTITVSADITNNGNVDLTSESVEFRLGGQTVATQQIDLDTEETTSVSFQINTTGVAPGTYMHGVFAGGASQTAEITIEESSNSSVVDVYDGDGDGAINQTELLGALADYDGDATNSTPEDGVVSNTELLELLAEYDAAA